MTFQSFVSDLFSNSLGVVDGVTITSGELLVFGITIFIALTLFGNFNPRR